MATQQSNPSTKKVNLSQVREDLRAGLTRWKKDDIGFGSLEKKYNLTNSEMIELLSHPKIKNIESSIPAFIIIDDIPDEQPIVSETPVDNEQVETRIEVVAPVQQVKTIKEQPYKKPVAFI